MKMPNQSLEFHRSLLGSTLRRLCSLRSLRITTDKREIKDFPKLPKATSFILKMLAEIPHVAVGIFKNEEDIIGMFKNERFEEKRIR